MDRDIIQTKEEEEMLEKLFASKEYQEGHDDRYWEHLENLEDPEEREYDREEHRRIMHREREKLRPIREYLEAKRLKEVK